MPRSTTRSAAPLAVFAVAVAAVAACAAPTPPVRVAPSLGVDPASMERTPGGVYVRTDREGQGLPARDGDVVVVHYTAWLADGTEVDSSRERGEPLRAELGPGSRLVRGWNDGLLGMRVGERRTLLIPPELGYGRAGAGGVIPPDAWLVFEIEMLELR